MNSTKRAAQEEFDAGRAAVPVPRGDKGLREPGWLERAAARDYTIEHFDDDGNIGRIPGKHSGDCVDVDLDAEEAVSAGNRLLPTTEMVHGRSGKPRSHHWYVCPGAQPRPFKDPVSAPEGRNDTAMLLEIRANNGHTLIPPSLHPSGERYEWHERGPAASIEWPHLERHAAYTAIAALLGRHWPSRGSRHQLALAAAGFLGRHIDHAETVAQILETALEIAGDEEIGVRMRAVRDTLAKLADDRSPTTGAPTFRREFPHGDKIADAILGWLGVNAAENDVIERLNERYFIVEVAGRQYVGEIVEEGDPSAGQRWSIVVYRTWEEFEKKHVKLPRIGKRAAARVWLESPRGRQFDRLVFAPPGLEDTLGPRDLNGWRGFTVEPAPGDWPRNRAHMLEVICAGDQAKFEWLMDWCAALVQRPGTHADTALVLTGGQGTGKGHFAQVMLGESFDALHYATITNPRRAFGNFNDILSGRCYVVIDDMTSLTKEQIGVAKSLITGNTLDVERKHMPVQSERSMLHFVFTTNDEHPIAIDADDRRLAFFGVSNGRANDRAYFEALHEELKNGGRAAMLHEWRQRAITHNLRFAPSSQRKDEAKIQSFKPTEAYLYSLLSHGTALQPREGIQPDHDGYRRFEGVEVLTSQLLANFRAVTGVTQKEVPDRSFETTLAKRLPPEWRFRDKPTMQRGYRLGSLHAAREHFCAQVGIAIAWEDQGELPLHFHERQHALMQGVVEKLIAEMNRQSDHHDRCREGRIQRMLAEKRRRGLA